MVFLKSLQLCGVRSADIREDPRGRQASRRLLDAPRHGASLSCGRRHFYEPAARRLLDAPRHGASK